MFFSSFPSLGSAVYFLNPVKLFFMDKMFYFKHLGGICFRVKGRKNPAFVCVTPCCAAPHCFTSTPTNIWNFPSNLKSSVIVHILIKLLVRNVFVVYQWKNTRGEIWGYILVLRMKWNECEWNSRVQINSTGWKYTSILRPQSFFLPSTTFYLMWESFCTDLDSVSHLLACSANTDINRSKERGCQTPLLLPVSYCNLTSEHWVRTKSRAQLWSTLTYEPVN